MRIKINLLSESGTTIPFDYNYNIYLNLRRILFEYLQVHKPKFMNRYKNSFPSFTFSQLMIPKREIKPGYIQINSSYFSLFISSVDERFIEYLINALYAKKFMIIFSKLFEIRKIDILESPEFSSPGPMKFKMMSPLFLAKKEREKIRFIRPEDADLNACFAEELIQQRRKYVKDELGPDQIKLSIDQNYIEQKKRMSRFFTIRNINYKTILAPIFLEGDAALIKFAYDNGIGSKTHYGFGMIDPV